jgi:hypothetical protein
MGPDANVFRVQNTPPPEADLQPLISQVGCASCGALASWHDPLAAAEQQRVALRNNIFLVRLIAGPRTFDAAQSNGVPTVGHEKLAWSLSEPGPSQLLVCMIPWCCCRAQVRNVLCCVLPDLARANEVRLSWWLGLAI